MVRPHQHSLCQSVSQPQSSSLSLLVSSSVSSSSLLLLFLKSYILPLFDYCDVVWSGCTKSEASRLETLLNYACRTVLHKCRGSSTSAARRELGLSILASRRKRHLVLTIFNCMSSKSPPYLSQLFPLPSSHYNTHSASSSQLNLPRNRSLFGQKSFSFMGAALWRSLSPNIRTPENSTVFTHFASIILGKIFDFYYLYVHDISLTCSS